MASEQSQQPTPFPSTDPEIRQAVLDFHKKECCFDKRPMKYMTISIITPMNAFRYILETFVETRAFASKTVPFKGQAVPSAKQCPEKWSVVVTPPPAPPGNAVVDFTETSVVMPCPTCNAAGRVECLSCGGIGFTICTWCHGRGRRDKNLSNGRQHTFRETERCITCSGTGQIMCTICGGQGSLVCQNCEGLASIVSWNVLNILWTLDVKTFNTSRDDLDHELLDKAQWSSEVVSQLSKPEAPKPLTFPAEPEITAVAAKYISGMMEQKDWRVLGFRQAVVEVPVVNADFQWKDYVGRFYVYGQDKQVHFPVKYPGSGCGGCCCCGNSPCVIV